MLPANYGPRPAARDERRPSARQLAAAAARFTPALLAGGLIACAAWVLLFLALGTLVFSPVAGLGLPFLAVMTWFCRHPMMTTGASSPYWPTSTRTPDQEEGKDR